MGKNKKKNAEYDITAMLTKLKSNTEVVDIGKFNMTELPKYAANVILKRHILEIKDGLKPIYRRLLMAMYDRKAYGGGKTDNLAKCSAINGRVLEWYHPHGDASAHQTLIGMGQEFRNNVQLVTYHGNFGSAANPKNFASMRYPQAKISDFAYDCFFREWNPPALNVRHNDLSTDYISNYADTCVEPLYLPARYPLFMFNWHRSMGTGRFTGTAGFNIIEACQAFMTLLDNPMADIEIYPDDPQGSTIVNMKDLHGILDKGLDSLDSEEDTSFVVKVRANYEIQIHDGETYIVITSVPYEVSPTTVEEKIATLAKSGLLSEVADVYNDDGFEMGSKVNIQVKIKKGYNPRVVMEKLYKRTELAKTFPFKCVFVNGLEAVDYTLRMAMLEWLKYRRISILRFQKIRLRDISKRCHVLNAMINIIDNNKLDDVIKIIKKNNISDAIIKLMDKMKLTDYQAESISKMTLSQLSADNYSRYKRELADKQAEFEEINKMIHNKEAVNDIIKSDLQECIDKYGTPRKSQVIQYVERSLVDDSDHILVVTEKFIKKLPMVNEGYVLGRIDSDDKIVKVLNANNRDTLAIFDEDGKMLIIPVDDIGECSSKSNGIGFHTMKYAGKVLGKVIDVLDISTSQSIFLTSITEKGMASHTELQLIENKKPRNITTFTKLAKGDKLANVCESMPDNSIIAYTTKGQAVIFDFDDITTTGMGAVGIKAITTDDGDKVVGVSAIGSNDTTLLVVTNRGYMKKFPIKMLPKTARNKPFEINSANGRVVSVLGYTPEEHEVFYAYTSKGGFEFDAENISATKRLDNGERVIELDASDYLFDVKC